MTKKIIDKIRLKDISDKYPNMDNNNKIQLLTDRYTFHKSNIEYCVNKYQSLYKLNQKNSSNNIDDNVVDSNRQKVYNEYFKKQTEYNNNHVSLLIKYKSSNNDKKIQSQSRSNNYRNNMIDDDSTSKLVSLKVYYVLMIE